MKAELYQQVGKLQVELEWLKKSPGCPVRTLGERRGWIDAEDRQLSVERQCGLAGFSRSGFYYLGVGESAQNLMLMRLLDEQYMRTPF